MLIQLVGRTLHSDNGDILCLDKGGNLCSDNVGTGHLSIVTSSKLKKLIQLVLTLIVDHTFRSDNSSTLISDNGCTAHLSKVTNCKLKILIRPVLIQLVGRTLH